ncbi:MAG: domain containing protein [Humibacillus sp.]|nr:domain containing protein [Humibacillus sp.]
MPTAANLLHDRLREQQTAVTAAEAAVRAGEPEGVHDLRVALRRLRSALATFRPLVDAEVTEPLRDELRWAAGQLGGARDAEVVAERILALLDEVAGDAPPEVVQRLRARVDAETRVERGVTTEALDSDRYATALALLDATVAQPPWTPKAERGARPTARRRLRRDARRVLDLAEHAWAATDLEHRNELLHDVRKAAKRLRYAAETAEPVLGKAARRIAAAATRVQTTLGDHHDDVVTREALRRLALSGPTERDGADAAFLLGRLDLVEDRAVHRLERRGAKDVRRLATVVGRRLG